MPFYEVLQAMKHPTTKKPVKVGDSIEYEAKEAALLQQHNVLGKEVPAPKPEKRAAPKKKAAVKKRAARSK
ncbi:hypothetical protein BOW53_03030 [Solemya pervernicosa gill symbiont]|uniref:Uncharacterized protein n=1 Tax=Solemya pervernicosa gill symbiont TaxID=642797 RepID=A0A1T2L9A0_9GAMM|nr:hypothetical protein [Solemya pervernicosa gill symbiont]OOZ41667.1 hypothetical protein BOW53_03030 [Solemya pervernicosa gill symbiont]